MSNLPNALEYTILSGADVGSSVAINRTQGFDGAAVVAVVMPAASDNVTFTLQGDYGDGTLRNITGTDGTAVTLTFGANLHIWLDPAITAGTQKLALLGNTGNETGDRTFQFLVRGVQ